MAGKARPAPRTLFSRGRATRNDTPIRPEGARKFCKIRNLGYSDRTGGRSGHRPTRDSPSVEARAATAPRRPISFRVVRSLGRKPHRGWAASRSRTHACNELRRARFAARVVAGRGRGRLYHPYPDSGAGDPGDPGRTRRHGRRADRHRQDRGLCPADPAEAHSLRQLQPVAGAPPRAGADPHPDARACDPGRGSRTVLRQAHEPALDGRLRRRRHQAAVADRARGRRDPGRDPRPAARPHRAQERLPRAGRSVRPRRGRPHARHGVHPRHQADHGAAARRGQAAEPAVLGDLQRRDQEARRRVAQRPAAHRGRQAQHRRRNRRAECLPGRERVQARAARAPRALAQPQPGAVLRADQARRVAARPRTGEGRPRHLGDPRRQGPEGAARGARGVQGRQAPGARRHRRRRPRPRHRRPAAGRQLRTALRSRGLHPPYRPHRTGRSVGPGDLVRGTRRRTVPGRDRAPAQEAGARRRCRGFRPRGRPPARASRAHRAPRPRRTRRTRRAPGTRAARRIAPRTRAAGGSARRAGARLRAQPRPADAPTAVRTPWRGTRSARYVPDSATAGRSRRCS